MLIGEPPRTQGDLNFVLFGFPVRVHPFFWLIALLLGLRGGDDNEPVSVLIWVAAVFVSILVHELGHAFAIRRFGGQAWITLYGMGGLASSSDANRSPSAQIQISAAGPAAGFVLAGAVLLAIQLAGRQAGLAFQRSSLDLETMGVQSLFVPDLVLFVAYYQPFDAPRLNELVGNLLSINFLWGFLNLLPVYPLDGGQIAREVLVQQNPAKGIIQSLWLSVLTAGCLAAYALTKEQIYVALLFGYFAYTSYATVQAYMGRGGGRGW